MDSSVFRRDTDTYAFTRFMERNACKKVASQHFSPPFNKAGQELLAAATWFLFDVYY